MTTVSAADGLRALSLIDIQLSSTGSQAERRRHFDKAALAELAGSIKAHGVLVPIIARPVNGHFELIAGERRYLAAKAAGVTVISADVRTLTDEQVLEIQLIENLQREGLHELAEAEGYEGLHKLGHSAEEIADKVGKSKAYVYGRMKLLALGPAAREAFYRGEISASIALLLARIPVASVQRDAVGEITKPGYGDPMSFRGARDYIEREYMLRLADASFPTGDAELLPKAGACGPCPKRTGNQAELFSDVKSADVCTDPVCYKLKREAWAKLQIAEAKEAGRTVITGADAKKIAGHGWVTNGYATLEGFCSADAKGRSFKKLLGKNRETVQLLQIPKTGEVVEVVNIAEAVKAAKKLGTLEERPKGHSPYAAAERKKTVDPAKVAEQEQLRDRLLIAIHKNAPTQIERSTLLDIVDCQIQMIGDAPQGFFTAWGWDADCFDKAPKLSDSQLRQLIFELALIDELPYGNLDLAIQQLTKAAKALGVDVKKVKADAAKLAGEKVAAPLKATKKAKAKK